MNYSNIAKAVEFYQECGYVYRKDAPWTVSQQAYYATKPNPEMKDIIIDIVHPAMLKAPVKPSPMMGFLVASGEQSFIQMMLDGQDIKRAICVTPCFRHDKSDDLQKPYFMKAELINAHDVDEGHLMHMIHTACSFFERFFAEVRVVKTAIGYDIVEKDTRIELGSYGIRSLDKLKWIYGTACAEPRLSATLKAV